MAHEFPRCSLSATVASCAKLIRNSDLRMVVVTGPEGELCGLVTPGDLVDRILATDQPGTAGVLRAMTPMPLITCRPDDGIGTARTKMRMSGKSRVPVVDSRGVCLGVVSLRDLTHIYDDGPEVEQPLIVANGNGR